MPPLEPIRVRGARAHNLKSIDLDLPHGELVVVTGVSGSGKSSLAFTTLFAEGQRRYIESFSAFARQFLERIEKPPCDSLTGLPPAIAIDRSTTVRSPRSTVATMTELGAHLKILYARAGTVHCDACGRPVRRDTPGAVARELLARRPGARAVVTFPYPSGSSADDLARARAVLARRGFLRVACPADSPTPGLPELVAAAEAVPGDGVLEVVADRLPLDRPGRLVEAIEQALRFAEGRAAVWVEGEPPRLAFELGRRSRGRTLYVLDEPTTGLHKADVALLVAALRRIVTRRDTVIVIEHNLEVVARANRLVDLGPEGGDAGGRVVATGRPRDLLRRGGTHTADALRAAVAAPAAGPRPRGR